MEGHSSRSQARGSAVPCYYEASSYHIRGNFSNLQPLCREDDRQREVYNGQRSRRRTDHGDSRSPRSTSARSSGSRSSTSLTARRDRVGQSRSYNDERRQTNAITHPRISTRMSGQMGIICRTAVVGEMIGNFNDQDTGKGGEVEMNYNPEPSSLQHRGPLLALPPGGPDNPSTIIYRMSGNVNTGTKVSEGKVTMTFGSPYPTHIPTAPSRAPCLETEAYHGQERKSQYEQRTAMKPSISSPPSYPPSSGRTLSGESKGKYPEYRRY